MGEVLAEMWREIAVAPGKYALEVAQFAILVLLVRVVAFGWGKRSGFVANMLSEHRERIDHRLAAAAEAEEHLRLAHERSAGISQAAAVESARIRKEAKRAARAETTSAHKSADAEAAAITEHAIRILEDELAEMQVEMRDRLVDLVARATRSVMNESYSSAEQREMVQRAVLAGVERIEQSASGASS